MMSARLSFQAAKEGQTFHFLLMLSVITALAIAIRLPGIQWLQGVAPYFGFTFHPDALKIIGSTLNFETPTMGGYPLGMTTHLYIVKKILDYFQTDKTYFIVVGAGHMCGMTGIVQLLLDRGLNVRQIDKTPVPRKKKAA